MAFDLELLDPDDPFEIDGGNLPHLFSHPLADVELLYEMWLTDPLFWPANQRGDADWLMVNEVPGREVWLSPLAPPNRPDPTKCRPIGLYLTNETDRNVYYIERTERNRGLT